MNWLFFQTWPDSDMMARTQECQVKKCDEFDIYIHQL
jgi:hypothetical protein